jgi:uncharacterized protein YhbP (UPF0306 family)
MTKPDSKIVKFIKRHHVMTLATTNSDIPYCCNLFYAYDEESAALIFTSDSTTKHTQMFTKNPQAACSIVLETRVVGKVQGLQAMGEIKPAQPGDKSLYIKRFPYALVADLTLWRMELNYLKLTDNTLGFGKKLIWQR